MTAIAEVPGAVWSPADSTNYGLRPQAQGGAYSLVVIHITDGRPDPYAVAQMWQRPYHGSSAHFVIGQDGTVLQCVALRFSAWHAHAANARSVGIEHCCRSPGELGPNDPGLSPSAVQLAASAKLIAYLLKAAGLTPARGVPPLGCIEGHRQADPQTTHADCPDGAPWPWDTYLASVAAEWAALPETLTT